MQADPDKLDAAYGFIARQCWHASAEDLEAIDGELRRLQAIAEAHRQSFEQPKAIDGFGPAHLCGSK